MCSSWKAPPAPLVPSSTVMGTWRSTSVSPALPCRSHWASKRPGFGVAALVLIQPLAVVTHQPLGIQDVDAIPRRLRVKPLADHPRADLIRHPDPASPGPVDQVVLLAQGFPLDLTAPMMPASTTALVPWMSSLNDGSACW